MILQTNWYKNIFSDSKKLQDEIFEEVKVVNLGSNQPKFAFDYKSNNVCGSNWGIGPQSLEYDFKVLKKNHKKIASSGTVIIPICPFSFFLYRFSDSHSYDKYYPFLPSSSIHCYSFRRKLLYNYFPILVAKRNILRLIKDSPLDTRFDISNNPMNDVEVKNDAQSWINSWKKQFALNSLDNITLTETNKENINKNISILRSMILFCKEKGYTPILLTIPVSEQLRNLVPESFVEEYVVSKINEANSVGAEFLNYWNDSEFLDKKYYMNSFFFNSKGREVFTRKVLSDLKLL